ncbi:hypothetical protein GCM10023328_22760 [Modestobacter marinus]|uniref:Uncharacterized protein n=1 Tax=Modestobacter marinus TaxID=477641 RepID=A0ABQ2FXQ3_9ACTN|nr:hypothetical protein GCM10011589_20610 [Modestobacter marinus]
MWLPVWAWAGAMTPKDIAAAAATTMAGRAAEAKAERPVERSRRAVKRLSMGVCASRRLRS